MMDDLDELCCEMLECEPEQGPPWWKIVLLIWLFS